MAKKEDKEEKKEEESTSKKISPGMKKSGLQGKIKSKEKEEPKTKEEIEVVENPEEEEYSDIEEDSSGEGKEKPKKIEVDVDFLRKMAEKIDSIEKSQAKKDEEIEFLKGLLSENQPKKKKKPRTYRQGPGYFRLNRITPSEAGIIGPHGKTYRREKKGSNEHYHFFQKNLVGERDFDVISENENIVYVEEYDFALKLRMMPERFAEEFPEDGDS